jgi:hypothetical protein
MRGPCWAYALIALLAFPVWLNSPAAGGFKGPSISVVKDEPSAPIEGIDVLDSSPYEDALGSVGYGGEIVMARAIQSREDGFSAWTHYGTHCRFLALIHTETGSLGLQHPDDSSCGRFIGRSLTEIFDPNLRSDSVAPVYKFDISVHDRDVSSQLPSCRFFCAANEVAGGHPKEDGRKSHYNGKRDESFIFPVVDEISEAIPVKLSPSNERREVLFRFILGGLFWVLLYAGLKRLGPLESPPTNQNKRDRDYRPSRKV